MPLADSGVTKFDALKTKGSPQPLQNNGHVSVFEFSERERKKFRWPDDGSLSSMSCFIGLFLLLSLFWWFSSLAFHTFDTQGKNLIFVSREINRSNNLSKLRKLQNLTNHCLSGNNEIQLLLFSSLFLPL